MANEDKIMDFAKIEEKWQKKWEDAGIFEVKENPGKKKYYVLEMYPYPSASGLHMGHAFNYTVGDIIARFKLMQGANVLHPMGYDSFGLPAENAAIKNNSHPKEYTDAAIKNFMRQQKALGLSYCWKRKIQSHDEEYYKWNQYFFLQFFKKGLVYRKKASANWCPKCSSVLANEQVHNGKCWVHKDTDIEIKNLEQWFIKTTAYADELLNDVDKLDWPDRIKIMQRNWIGKSVGTEVNFEINGEKWPIFTTRIDTIYGATFMVISAQHPRIMELVADAQKKEVESFLKKIKSTSEKDAVELEKEGVFTGSYAVNPLTKEKIPVWAGNFVLADYGSGMVMAVPAHDQRDFEFAKKYNIEIKEVIAEKEKIKVITIKSSLKKEFYEKVKKFARIYEKQGLIYIYTDKIDEVFELARENFIGSPWYIHSEGDIKKILVYSKKDYRIYDWGNNKEKEDAKKFGAVIGIKKEQLDFDEMREAYFDDGILVNSGEFNSLESSKAREKITALLESRGLGKRTVLYKLRDWLVSRQRYWGTPIPLIYCSKCGIVPVPEKELPVKLPEKIQFGEGNPLATNLDFVNVKCPKCRADAKRETDTMDTFFDSSWYYLRFTDLNKKKPFDEKKAEYWMPVDFYTGGAEHACMHLIYARFFTKALRDMGFIKIDEPFIKLFNQGMIHGEDGFVMSKSRGNVADPLDITAKFGADALRLFLVSSSSPDKDSVWSIKGIESSFRLINKIFNYALNAKIGNSSRKIEHKTNKAIKDISEDIINLAYNSAVIKLRALADVLENEISKKDLESFIKLISPFCPHTAEELWEKIGNKPFISLAQWPECDEKKIDMKIEESEKAVEKTIDDMQNIMKIIKEKTGKEGEKVYLYVIPNELENYSSELLSRRIGAPVKVFAVNDRNKYDPEGKAGKAKPGKPGIYIE